jgi:ABC-type molybdate transport system permease subunit
MLAVVLWPIVWLLSLPLALIGIGVGAALAFIKAILSLPARILGYR